jgi:hypothetical protein
VRSLYIYIFDQGLSLEIVLLAIEKREGITDLAESLTIMDSLKELDEKACQRSPSGAKMWNSHIFSSLPILVQNT